MLRDVEPLLDALRLKEEEQLAEIVSAQFGVSGGRGHSIGINYQANESSCTILMVAVEMRNEVIVQLLLQKGADVNITGGGDYGAAVIVAAYHGHKGMVQLLLENGADPNIVGGKYGTALIAAARSEHKEIVQLLLQNGADPNIVGGKYGTALIAAACSGQKEIFHLLLENRADIIIAGGDYGTALITAAYHGHKEIAHLLFEKGADPNIVVGDYGTALITAAYHGHKELVQLLLENGADPNIVVGDYGAALIAAALSRQKEIVQLLFEDGADPNLVGGRYGTALIAAAYHGHKEMVHLLLENGAHVNITGGDFETALTAAACSDQRDIVRVLLEEGADVNIAGGRYGTPLTAAAYHGHKGMVQLLLESEADPSIVFGNYGTALIVAALYGHKEVVQLLLQNGADVNTTGGDYGTAFIAAACSEKKEIVQLLHEKGADVNISDGKYGTALSTAAYYGHEEMVQLLLEKGADVNISSGRYGTALSAAAYHGHEAMVQLLLENGADPNTGGGRYNNNALATVVHRIAVEGAMRTSERLLMIARRLLNAGADPNSSYSVDWGKYHMNTMAIHYLDTATYSYRSLRWSLLGVALQACDALTRDGYDRADDLAFMLLREGAEFNTINLNADYLTAVRDLVNRRRGREMVALILENGRDVNKMDCESWTLLGQAVLREDHMMAQLLFKEGADVNLGGGEYGTPLGLAVLQKDHEMAELLLKEGADVNLGGGEYGTPLGVAMARPQEDRKIAELLLEKGADINKQGGRYGGPVDMVCTMGSMEMVSLVLEWGGVVTEDYGSVLSRAASAGNTAVVSGMLDLGADINSVDGKYGTALGAAVSGGHKETVSMLLTRGAMVMRVGGWYHTALGTYPTALDAAASSSGADDTGLLTLLTKYATATEQEPWPPFPIPYAGILESDSVPVTSYYAETLQTAALAKDSVFCAGEFLTTDQASVACRDLDEEVLISLLGALVGLDRGSLESLKGWTRNDIRYFVSHGFDFGLAYAAARVGWNDFKGHSDSDVARHRYSWLEGADRLDKARAMEISRDSAGQELIKAPYSVMPRRVWDLKSNRVVAYNMLHAKTQATHIIGNPATAPTRPPFWAISHSWTDDMEAIDTPINGYQWPVPLPRNISLEGVRKALIDLGAEYVWLDVLCLRQHSYNPSHHLKQDEWKLDVPTIGNIYRAAERVVRYFNGLGMAFSEHGWDSPRHWLRRAWTLQEIKTENTTYNGGVARANVLNTQGKVSGKDTTLRCAIRPVLRLAAEVDSPGGCSVYELAREMAKRYATQPTDKVAGLLYLLRTSELPTYDETITDEDAWRKCIPLLPLERKIELLFDFPYRGLLQGGWFPTWKQVLGWPERDPDLEHTRSGLQKDGVFELSPTPGTGIPPTEFICKVWAIPNVFFQETGDPNDYEVKIADKVFGFYSPYLVQQPINISNNRPFTLTAMFLGQSHNWVVCEYVGERKEKYKPAENYEQKEILVDVDVVILRKIGVLRTDSCSELMVVAGEYKLTEIQSVFV